MSTLKVDTIDTSDSSGNITVSRPLSGSGVSLTALNATNLASGTVATTRLGSGTANSGVFLRGDGTWDTAGSTSASDLTSGTLPIARIADDAITTAKIAPDAITAAEIADDAINSEHYAAASIDNEHLADDAVGVAELSATGTASSTTFLRGDNSWVAVPDEVTKSSSDPTISTNPSGGVGTVFVNTTSGETYVCTDATTGANVWTNIGGGTGDIQPYSFQGTVAGYAMGGSSITNIVDKYSFTSDANATDSGDLSVARTGTAGHSSTTHGYCSAGGASSGVVNIIDKFPFSSGGNLTDVGDISLARTDVAGTTSSTHGYTHGGHISETRQNRIDKFSTVSDANGTDVGDLTIARVQLSSNSSSTHGYASGGDGPSSGTRNNAIDKYTFSSDANASDVGDLTLIAHGQTGTASTTHGYTSGGFLGDGVPNNRVEVIDRFPFASDTNASDVGDLTVGRTVPADGSSTTHGYNAGGYSSSGPTNVIDKFAYAASANATDVGDITSSRYLPSGCQY